MNNNQSENKEPDFFTPNAPIKYVMAGGRGVMIGCGIITALYVIGVIVGLCLGYGWSSLLLPFLPFIVIGFIGYIWEMFKKFYNLGYDEKRRIYEGGNLAASKIRNLECPSYEICLIDYGCGKFNRKIHIMEQYP